MSPVVSVRPNSLGLIRPNVVDSKFDVGCSEASELCPKAVGRRHLPPFFNPHNCWWQFLYTLLICDVRLREFQAHIPVCGVVWKKTAYAICLPKAVTSVRALVFPIFAAFHVVLF